MINYQKLFLIYILLFFSHIALFAQIGISNNSMEGKVADASMPSGWFAQSDETTPDILPGYWGVYLEPDDGESYVGLITRQDGSFESIGQRLESKMKKDQCYKFSLSLAHSDNYSGYNKPVFLRIWIGQKNKSRDQLIFSSPLIDHLEWKSYPVQFVPDADAHYIIIEAYISDKKTSHKGNILIDNISEIFDCNRA